MAVTGLQLVSIPVADQARARRFYVETLGFSVAIELPDFMGPGKSWIMLRPGWGEACVTLVNWFETMPAGSLRGLVFGVDDIEAEFERLKNLGVDIDPPQTKAWGRYSTLRDSEGNGIVLQQPSAR